MKSRLFTRFSILGVLTLMLGAFVSADVAQQRQPSRKDVERARTLTTEGRREVEQRNHRAALEKFSEAVKLNPKNAEAHLWKGYAHYELKENDFALAELEQARDLGARPLDVYKVRANVHYELKNYDAALADMNEIIKAEPSNPLFLVRMGEISEAKGEFREALNTYQKAVLTVPNSGDVYYRIARIEASLGNHDAVLAAADEAIKRGTQHLGETYLLIGDVYRKQRKLTEAADAYKRAIAAKPDRLESYRTLAEIYRNQNRFDDSIAISKKAVNVFPRNAQLYTDLSLFYGLAGRHQDAVDAALAAISFDPESAAPAYTNLCRAYNDTKQYQLAVSACNNALRRAPDDGETLFYLGRAFDLLGEPEEATKHYKRALEGMVTYAQKNPDSSDAFYLLGNVYFANNLQDKAVDAYKRTLELSPRFARARFNLGIIYVLNKNKAGAEEQLNSLIALDKDLADRLKAEINKL